MTDSVNTSPAHTPGPWTSHDFWVGNEGGMMVADCVTEHNKNLPSKEKYANARLIAAAPELRDACNYAVGVLESMPEDMREQLADILDEDIEFDWLNAVLAKADSAGS